MVDRLIPDFGWTLCTGKPKVYKSFFRRYLTACMMTGQPAFGEYPVVKPMQRVLAVLAEDHPGAEKRYTTEVLRAMGADEGLIENLSLFVGNSRSDPLYINQQKHLDELLRQIDRIKPEFIFLDPLRNHHTLGETNDDYAKLVAVLSQISASIPVLVNHHETKPSMDPNAKQRDLVDRARGGIALTAGADMILSLTSHGGRNLRTLSHTGKLDPDPGDIDLMVNTDTWVWSKREDLNWALVERTLAQGPLGFKDLRLKLSCRENDLRRLLKQAEEKRLAEYETGPMNAHIWRLT